MKYPRVRQACVLVVLGAAAGLGASALDGVGIPIVAPAAAQNRTQRDQYIADHQNDFMRWGQKVAHYNAEAKKTGSEVKQKVQKEIDGAWQNLEKRWASLKQAGNEDWQKAKAAYEKSRQKLEQAWRDAKS